MQTASHHAAGASLRPALTCLALCMLMPSLDTSIANAGLPTLARALGASFQQAQWIVLAYLVAVTTLIVSVARWGDLVGRRRLLLGGIALFTLASLLCGTAPALGWLIAARAVQGLGAAVMMALTVAFVGETVPKAKTGSAMGLLGTMSAVGTSLGPSLGGMLMATLSWHAIFLVNVPLGIANWLLAYHYLPHDRPTSAADRPRFDYIGTLLLALTLMAYALAMTIGHAHFGWFNATLLSFAAVGAVLFVLAQARSAAPLIRLALFRDPVLSASLAASTLVSAVMMTTLVVGPFYLSLALGLKTAAVGFVLSAGPLVSALCGVPAGWVVDRFGAPRVAAAGLAALACGCAALSLLSPDFGIAGYLACIVVVTPGYAAFQAANNTLIMADVRADERGVVSGLLSLSRNLGLITGASVMASVFAFASAMSGIASAHAAAAAIGMHAAFAVATVLIVAALAIATASRILFARRAMTGDSA
ncbi:MFS transporter [Dyella mobilis]|uniref:MFS transporter n=1 Tax=Dyella mobilis TaxID=1849582 RepID=A0ABS2KF07_9GAMM|nr:MFS transporter [Dyella mobilis]MBM7129674.1 MFS transporter [Dyella mobilis]GLQ98060.1 MFS transporter [Dyella mobilis]